MSEKELEPDDYMQQFHNHEHFVEHEDDDDADDAGSNTKLAALREAAGRLTKPLKGR